MKTTGGKAERRVTVPTLRRMKRQGQPITVLTVYDATFARLLDQSGIDVLLVGDSLGMVIKGDADTLGVTVEEVIYHCRAVRRGVERAHLVADMPFMSYQASIEEGVRNAGRLLKEGGAAAVKVEGGSAQAELVARLSEIGIPVMGHIGLTPQSVHAFGGYRVQGRHPDRARQLAQDALALQQAGAYALVLESMPRELAQSITAAVEVPTIGIGAGAGCDGQVLVLYDVLGLDDSFEPRFVKRYEHLAGRVRQAVERYAVDVRSRRFPAEEHSWTRDGATRVSEETPVAGELPAESVDNLVDLDPTRDR